MEFKNPYYQLYISNSSCSFEVRVNDMHAIYFNFPGTVAFDQPVNHLMLQSGTQKVSVRILPPPGQQFLSEQSKIEIKVQVMEATSDFSVRNDVASYLTEPFTEKDVPGFEHHFEFESKLPYKLEGWQRSSSLKEVDDLKQQLINWYKKMHQVIADKDRSTYERLNSKAYHEDATSMYDAGFMQEHLKEVFGYLNDPDFNLVPLDEDALQVRLYGDGKVASLRWPDQKPAIYLDFPIDKSQYSMDFFLHKPLGSSDFEVIR
jgi:hypothetical protein